MGGMEFTPEQEAQLWEIADRLIEVCDRLRDHLDRTAPDPRPAGR